jgi:glycosyltransferase involved in cell wall biosynthesis
MAKQIVFLSPNGFGDKALEIRVFDRLNLYLERLHRIANFDFEFFLFIPGEAKSTNLDFEQNGHIKIIRQGRKTNFLTFTIKALCSTKQLGIAPNLFIAGDVRFAFLSAVFFKIRYFRAKLQVQLHGNYSSLLIHPYLPRFIVNSYYYFVFRFVTSARMVSCHQLASFPLFLQSRIRNVVIAEIPYLSKTPSRDNSNFPRSIGFVGRIHPERGLDLWAMLANHISELDRDITFVIVGDGVAREKFFSMFDGKTFSRLDYRGWLNASDLDLAWRTIGALLVTAESESFGIVMREALLRGIYVIALENEASKSLKNQFPECVYISTKTQDLVKMALSRCGKPIPDDLVESVNLALGIEQRTAIQKVANSWLQELQSH